MEKNKNTKINNGCLKIFKLIELLFEDKAYYEDVINIFKDEFEDQSANNIQVVLNKHLNTLKVFGIKVVKENNKFKMGSCLYPMDFSIDDLKSINLLANLSEQFPDSEISHNVNSFIRDLLVRMSSEDRITLSNLNTNYDFSFYYSGLKEQIEQCRKICNEGHLIDLKYMSKGKEYSGIFTPIDIIFDTKNAYLSVCNTTKNIKLDIPLTNILNICQTPNKSNIKNVNSTAVYLLKGRLAKTYKPKENEYISERRSNGDIVIVCKNESEDKLLTRLMRYSYSCEVLTPATLKKQIIELINETISNYE